MNCEYIVYGVITLDTYSESIDKSVNPDTTQKNKSLKITKSARETIEVNFKVINVKSGVLVASKTYSTNDLESDFVYVRKNENALDYNFNLNRERSTKSCIRYIIKQFSSDLLPTVIKRTLWFNKPDDMPEIELAAKRLDSDNPEAAIETLIMAAARPDISVKSKAQAYNDAGRIYEAYFDWKKAAEFYKFASDLLPTNKSYLEDYDNALKKIREIENRF